MIKKYRKLIYSLNYEITFITIVEWNEQFFSKKAKNQEIGSNIYFN